MSNYSTSYNINQTGDLYILKDHGNANGLSQYNSTRGTTVNAPVNFNRLKLFKGLDNELHFFIKNQDRKPIQLFNMDINASLVYRETSSTIFSAKCQITDYDLGSVKLLVRASHISNIDLGLCDLVLTYTNELGLVLPMYVDQNMRPNFTVEISNDAHAVPLTTQTVTEFLTDTPGGYNYSSIIVGPSYYNKPNGVVTFGVYCTNYTGNVYMQGATTATTPGDDDWFDIILNPLSSGYHHPFSNFTGIEAFSIKSNLSYIRAKVDNTGSGTVDKVVTRV
jgi:hypothetical protein